MLIMTYLNTIMKTENRQILQQYEKTYKTYTA